MKKVILSTVVLSFATVAFGAEMEWATPESQGVSSSAIAAWLAASDGVVNLHGFVIARHGKMIAEGAWATTTWTFNDLNVEPLFKLVGTREAIAAGVWTNPKTLKVAWHLFDCTQKGTFECKMK